MTFQDVLIRKGVRYRLSSDGSKIHLNCLFCSFSGKPVDTKMRLCIHLQLGWGKCVHCEWKRRTNSVKAVLKQLGIQQEISGFHNAPEAEEIEPVRLPDDFQLLTEVYDELERKALEYILKRGVTKKQIRSKKIGVSFTGKFAYRIIFPVYMNDELITINGRDFTGNRKPKYLLHKGGKCLYNFDSQAETVILSEGVIKALRIEQVTQHSSAALLGHDLTDMQFEQIRKSKCQEIIIYPDTDAVGKRGALNIADKLSESWNGKVKFVWPVTQPADDIPLTELKELLTHNLVTYNFSNRIRILL